jgi:arsenical pump membrane protein
VLAALIGLNVGPNLTYLGSLANLLWRRVAAAHGDAPPSGELLRVGLRSVPLALAAATASLWLVQRLG